MRWGDKPVFHGASVAAPSVGARDEDLYYHFPTANHSKQHAVDGNKHYKPVIITSKSIATVARKMKSNQTTTSVLASSSPVDDIFAAKPNLPFISTTSKGESSNFNDSHLEECSKPKLVDKSNPSTDTARKMTPRPSSALQRTDSELEVIIQELREKVALQHHTEEEVQKHTTNNKRKNAKGEPNGMVASRSNLSSTDSTPFLTGQHSRKYLKNPVERIQDSTSSIMSKGISGASKTMLVPLAGVSQQDDTKCGQRSNDNDDGEVEGFRIRSLTRDPSRSKNNAHHDSAIFRSSTSFGRPTTSTVSVNVSGGETVKPKAIASHGSLHVRRHKPQTSTKTASRNYQLYLPHGETPDSNDSDDEASLPWSTSPLGPWVGFSSQRVDTFASGWDSRSPTNAPLSSPSSSTGSPRRQKPTWQERLAALSPRSRLLWISDSVDREESSTSCSELLRLHRSATHQGLLRPFTALDRIHTTPKPPTAISQKTRCSSAKIRKTSTDLIGKESKLATNMQVDKLKKSGKMTKSAG